MERITPERVIEAYKATRLTPMRGGYFPKEGCACGLGAIATELRLDVSSNLTITKELDLLMNSSYRAGFARGFDGDERYDAANPVEFEAGYQDGQAAWRAAIEDGLTQDSPREQTTS